MTRHNRRHILSLMGATALSSCAPAIMTVQPGEDPFEGGIGGTGIVGLMTGTGSVLVNGLRIEVPDRTHIFVNGSAASDTMLVPGTALSMVANARRGRFEAQQIDIDAPLIGILTRSAQGLSINGTRIQTDASARSLIGQRIIAHGLWQPDGSLRVSLLQITRGATDSVAGVASGTPHTGWTIGQTPVTLPRGRFLIAGQFAVASGSFAGGRLTATSIQMGRFRGGQALRQLSIEGYLEPTAAAPGFQISGLGHSFDRRLTLDPFAQARALYFGPYDGRFGARRALILPENQGARQALLQPSAGSNFAQSLTSDAHPIQTQ